MKRTDRNAAAAAAINTQPEASVENNGHPDLTREPGFADFATILASLQTMRDGDFSVRLPGSWTGLAGKIAGTFNEIVAANQQMAEELKRVGQVVGKEGQTRERTRFHESRGAWGEMEISVNTLVEDLLRPTAEVIRVNSELARKNQELDAIMHTAPDIIFSRRADGARDYISDRFYEYTGAPAGSAIVFGWLEFVHPEDRERSMVHWMRCAESGDNYESEYRMRGKDGQYRWFRARAVPIRDFEGNILKWYGTCCDIHDSKVLEQSIRDNAIELERIVDDRTAALRRLSGRLITMQDDERRRIARELHDGLGQELAAAKMMMDGILRKNSVQANKRTAAEATETIDRAIQQVRSLSHLLHPPLLDEVGLLSALQWYLDGLTKRSGIETSLDVHPSAFPRLAPELETAIFRIVQEALTNVYRHSGAQKAWVTLTQRASQTVIAIRDDGKGIEDRVSELRPGSIGIGISGMSQRAKEFGAELRLTNASPGTLVEVVVPAHATSAQRTHAMADQPRLDSR